ncbi:MAG TPA: FAD-dependent oxidoreductase [Pyrinomonadaceae bacterium]|nr:FAD-dependent oxidoreductase [Pyrinomonadaceae bacterium]
METPSISQINRRGFLRGALATSALLTVARSRGLAAALDPDRHFAPVKVSRDRIIREVVGLRPYRPEGFKVEAERIGDKLLVHNYGHGGAGITLSWGTASLAVDLARDFLGARTSLPQRRARSATHRHFAVLGCGVNGLSTARLLQRRFQDGPGTVTIYAKDLPPETTSNIAGGFWSPTSVFDPEHATAKFTEQFRLACRISNRAFQNLVGPEYGVRWMETLELSRNEASLTRELTGGNDLYPQIEIHRDPDNYFGFPYVKQYNTMLIEPPVYLNALLRDFYIAGGKLVVKEFHSREEIKRLPEPVIFNCTGLGARALFGDQQLEPVRGQLEVLLPQPEIDYCYLSSGYMFPRRDGIILGGTWDHGDWSLAPKPEQTDGILAAHAEIMKGLKQ